jgi:hypothetical protein
MSGRYINPMVKAKHSRNTFLTFNLGEFKTAAENELREKCKNPKKRLFVRIHSSGDFYSIGYLRTWIEIAKKFPDVTFYGYTKMVSMLKAHIDEIPANMIFAYSFGGKEDRLIDVNTDKHAFVFETKDALIKAGYDDGSTTDKIVMLTNKIGLVYHNGNMRYDRSNFKSVQIPIISEVL